jgi:hypothetical protein
MPRLANRYAWWLTGGGDGCTQAPTILGDAWSDEPADSLLAYAVWPETDAPVACVSVWNPVTRETTFPNSPEIAGAIREGLPPGGDYVPRENVGVGYLSPGYG